MINYFIISRRIRFINFIIDLFLYSIIVSTLLVILNKYSSILNQGNENYQRIISILFYILYYFIFEFFIQTTPGKLITKCKVISIDLKTPSILSILLRSIFRIIPLEPISIFFTSKKECLHDKLSKTKIIRVKN